MIHPETFVVRKQDERPARRDGTCFYCREKIGHKHAMDCVIKSRTVLLRYSVIVVESVPVDWDDDYIERHYNDGSWCGSNIIDKFKELHKRDGCLCNRTRVAFLHEATAEDEKVLGIPKDL